MDTRTGKVDELAPAALEAIKKRLGRDPVPGDRVDEDPKSPRVIISAEAASKLARDEHARKAQERELRRRHSRRQVHIRKHEKGRARRKRLEARRRAGGDG